MEIGIDIGGTKISGGLVHNGRVVRKLTVPTPKRRDDAVRRLREMVAWLSKGKRVGAIGVGVPGFYEGTKVTFLPNTPSLCRVDMKRALGAKVPVRVENDARCFALAEHHYGAARGKKNAVGIILGTGVGGAIIVEGKLYRGNGGAGEIGHMRLPDLTSVEDALCGPGIVARHRRNGGSEDHPAKIWASKSAAAKRTRRETEDALALLIANLAVSLDPQVIVLGGGVSNLPLVAAIEERLPGCKGLVKTGVVVDAGIIGAALVARAKQRH